MKSNITALAGGVCSPMGYTANGIHCGLRRNSSKPDLALLVSEVPASVAAIYTQNMVKGAPLIVTKSNVANGVAQAIICNSGNANTCSSNGIAVAQAMCALTQQHTDVLARNVIVASTGVIGVPLPLQPIEAGMAKLVAGLQRDGAAAARAIMTTDTYPKECAVSFSLNNITCRIGCMAKGSGMIHPNMATMLAFLTTDISISSDILEKVLKNVVDDTLNMISVDGDTSTNDMCCILANGLAGNAKITEEGAECEIFEAALRHVLVKISKMLAADGEGATKLITCKVEGAHTNADARKLAKSVIGSNLLKCAIFGADANWGRVLCAMGNAGTALDVANVCVDFCSAAGTLAVCKNGAGLPFSEELAKQILSEKEVEIEIACGGGTGAATAWGCDLTYDYIKINGDYRT